MRKHRFTLSHALIFAAASLLSGASLAQEVSLPGGASTLREAHGDWTVTCAIQTGQDGSRTKLCALSQEQLQQRTRQRVLAIELRPESEGVKGTLVLPFGLALDSGAAYQLDEGEAGAPQRFRTCMPAGCLIGIDFDARTIASLTAGKALKVKATADGGQEMNFSITLAGFSSAYARVVALSN